MTYSLALRTIIAFLIVSVSVGRLPGDETVSSPRTELKIGDSMPAFALKDYRGKSWSSASDWQSKKVIAVVFCGVECPLVRLYSGRLTEYQEAFSGDVQIIAINSNRQDSITEMAHFARQTKIEFPYLKDPGNRIADAFGAERTPEVFLFNAARELCYHGAIDDQYTYGRQRPKAEKNFLHDAIVAVSQDKRPDIETSEADGCIIGRIMEASESSEVTYANQISRIFSDRCVRCHRTGEVAPFCLTDYDEVVGWAEMIREVVNDRRMPPWHANPDHGTFKNDVSLSNDQLKQINTWVENGAPLGDLSKMPEPREFVEGWQIGEPDAIVEMSSQPFEVPATGDVPYQYFEVDPGFKEDKWISAAECRIGNRAVVHHILVGIKDGKGLFRRGQIQSEWLTATAPGSPPMQLPEGFAKLIPAGSKLVFQMHYTPNGTKQTDLSSVGFKFADPKTVRKSVGTREIINSRFKIPAGASNHEVRSKLILPKETLVLSLFPHMHLRGKSFRYIAQYPDGHREILLDIPNYDFNWQNGYVFEEPWRFPAGTVLRCVAHFDNSEQNFSNPDPTVDVRWGDQTWEEMMIGYIDMSLADQELTIGKDDGKADRD